jgi:hypothetical protein
VSAVEAERRTYGNSDHGRDRIPALRRVVLELSDLFPKDAHISVSLQVLEFGDLLHSGMR